MYYTSISSLKAGVGFFITVSSEPRTCPAQSSSRYIYIEWMHIAHGFYYHFSHLFFFYPGLLSLFAPSIHAYMSTFAHTHSYLHVPMLLYSVSSCVSSHLQGERENHEAESKPLLSYPTPSVQTASESLAILLQHTFVLPNKSGMV